MKKLIRLMAAGAAAAVLTIGSASMALAESTYPVQPTGGSVAGAGGSTAFTGADGLPFAVMMAAGLLVVGLVALYAARRRSARVSG